MRLLQLLACKVVFLDNSVLNGPSYRVSDFYPHDGSIPPPREREDLIFIRLLGILHEAALFEWETEEIPKIGRFKGLAASAIFRSATRDDLSDFLDLVIAFREAYQGPGHRLSGAFLGWALQGAPTVEEACIRAEAAKSISKKHTQSSYERK